ncbi:MAG: M48 family metallopeptidase [Pseudomonadota bacterium]
MTTFNRLVALCALSCSAALATAQQPLVQDGIQVREMSRFRVFISEEKLEQQAQLQYVGLLSQAQEKHALAPDNHPQLIRLRAIAKRLIPFAPRWNPAAANWKWQVNLLGSPQVNAFCMPGGRIAFYSGILSALKLTDDEIAAIMGHEISHALREHGREQAGKSATASIGLRLLGAGVAAYSGVDPRTTDYIANAGAKLASLKFSRDDEREADLIGLDLAARAGFDPRAGVALWQKMAQLNKQQPLALLSTHPGGQERIEQINAHMNVLLPLYARSKGTTPDRLAPYRTVALN